MRTYIELEGNPAFEDDDKLAQTASMVTTLHRAVVMLFVLRLVKTDPLLAYQFPRTFEGYCLLRGLPLHYRSGGRDRRCHDQDRPKTIGLREAIERVRAVSPEGLPSLLWFELLVQLRHEVEHHWDLDEPLLERLFGMMSTRALPSLQHFITDALQEDSSHYLDPALVEKVHGIDGNPVDGLSPALAKRIELHQEAYLHGVDKPTPNYKGRSFGKVLTDSLCPVCKNELEVTYDLVYDCDWNPDGVIEHVDPVPVFIHCTRCEFSAEGGEVDELFCSSLTEFIEDRTSDYEPDIGVSPPPDDE
jgi:hypothetical protein